MSQHSQAPAEVNLWTTARTETLTYSNSDTFFYSLEPIRQA